MMKWPQDSFPNPGCSASELFLVLFSACDRPHWSIVNTSGDELRKLLEEFSWRRCQVPLTALGYYLFWDGGAANVLSIHMQ